MFRIATEKCCVKNFQIGKYISDDLVHTHDIIKLAPIVLQINQIQVQCEMRSKIINQCLCVGVDVCVFRKINEQ